MQNSKTVQVNQSISINQFFIDERVKCDVFMFVQAIKCNVHSLAENPIEN